MTIETTKFVRQPFEVEAIQVTATNMLEVAAWCKGKVLPVAEGSAKPARPFIQVDVKNPQSPRQETAFVGDWVLFASNGFKVYTPNAFRKSFAEVEGSSVIHEVLPPQSPEDETLFVLAEELVEKLKPTDPSEYQNHNGFTPMTIAEQQKQFAEQQEVKVTRVTAESVKDVDDTRLTVGTTLVNLDTTNEEVADQFKSEIERQKAESEKTP